MGAFEAMHRALDRARGLPPFRQLRRAAFERRFAAGGAGHAFRGRYASFEAAAAAAPDSRPLGYDHPAAAEMYVQRLQPDQHDHPALFWLEKSFHEGMRSVADLGGSVGIKYFAFQELLDYPAGMSWRVIEVPAAVRRGREFAAARSAGAALQFSDRVADASGADLLYASGVLQYLPQTLPEILADLAPRPRRLLVNTTPIHPERSFFTLNSIGTAFCPYRVQARAEFLDGIRAQGYALRAEWQNLGKRLDLHFEPGCSLEHYSGFCFDRLPAQAGA